MTKAESITQALLLYNEATGDFISSTALGSLYQSVIEDICEDTLCYPLRATYSIQSGVRDYSLPRGMFQIMKNGVSTTTYAPLPQVSVEDLMFQDTTYYTTTGTPYCWYPASTVASTPYADDSWGITLYPVPDAAVSDGLSILGYGVPDISGDSWTPPWPTAYHDVIAYGLCVKAATLDIAMEAQNKNALAFFKTEFEEKKMKLKKAASGAGAYSNYVVKGSHSYPNRRWPYVDV